MGKGDGSCDGGTTTRRNLEQEVSALQEEVLILKNYLEQTAGAGRDELQGEVSDAVSRLEEELGQAHERIEDLEEKSEAKGLAKLWQKAVKDKGLYFGGAAAALGLVTFNPLLMAVGGAAMGLNKLRHMREAEDRANFYTDLRGGRLNVTISELEQFKNLSRQEQERIIKEKEQERQENGNQPVVSFMEEAPAAPRSPESEDEGRQERDIPSQTQEEPPAPPDPDDLARAYAQSATEEATDRQDKEIRDWLRDEQKENGENFGDEISDRAVMARELLLASQAAHLPEDDEAAIRSAVAQLEGEAIHSEKELAAERKKLESEEKSLMREQEKFITPYRKDIDQLEKEKAKILEQRQQLEAAGQLSPGVDEEINNALLAIGAKQQQIQQTMVADGQQFVVRRQDLQEKIGAYNNKVAVKNSPALGSIPSLVNLVLDREGQAACRSCGRVPRTVRRACSGCGTPFVISPDTMPLVGRGDEGLREIGHLSLVEEFEGDAARRSEKIALWRQGRGTVSSEEVRKRKKRSGEKKKGGTESKAKSGGKAKSKGGQPKRVEASTVAATVREGLDGSVDDYVAARNAARSKQGTEIHVAGLTKFNKEIMSRMKTPQSQADAVVDGDFPFEFGVFKNEGNLRSVNKGDRAVIRENANQSIAGGNPQRVVGYADVREVIKEDVTEEEAADPKKLQAKLDSVWGRIKEDMPPWYKQDDFNAFMTGKINNGGRKIAVVCYENEQRLSSPIDNAHGKDDAMSTQGGGMPLRSEAPNYQEIVDVTYRRDYEVQKGSKPKKETKKAPAKKAASKTRPKKAAEKTSAKNASGSKAKQKPKKIADTKSDRCEATTADGKPCKKLKSPRSKYCVIHKKQKVAA